MTKPTRGRKATIFFNTFFNLLAWIFPLVLGFVATPIILESLGNETYGLYALLLGFITYSFAWGIGRTAGKYVAEFRAAGKSEKINEVVSAIFWLSLGIGFAGLLIISVFARAIVSDILQIPPEQQETALTGLYIASATMLLAMLSQIFQSILQGLHQFVNYSFLTIISGLLLNLGNIVLVLSGYGVLDLLAWNLFVAAGMTLAFFIRSRMLLPELKIRFSVRGEMFSSVLTYGASIIFIQLSSNIVFLLERGLIVRYFGPETLTFYVIPMALAIYLNALVVNILVVLFPVVNELLTDRAKLTELYQTAVRLIIALLAFSVGTFISAGGPLLSVWIGPELALYSYSILVIHALTFSLMAVTMPATQISEGFHFAWLSALMNLILVAIAIPLMIILMKAWQSEGIAAARLIGVLAIVPFIFFIEKKFLGKVFINFWVSLTLRLLPAMLLLMIFEWLVLRNTAPSWLIVIFGIALGGVVFTSVLFLTGYLNKNDRQMLRSLFATFQKKIANSP